MTRPEPDVRRINMLSEYRDPDTYRGGTQAFWRSLSEADEFVHQHDRAAELECRCDELTQLVADVKQLHAPVASFGERVCDTCSREWPCPTMKLIERGT